MNGLLHVSSCIEEAINIPQLISHIKVNINLDNHKCEISKEMRYIKL
jgi:hypothetical protein